MLYDLLTGFMYTFGGVGALIVLLRLLGFLKPRPAPAGAGGNTTTATPTATSKWVRVQNGLTAIYKKTDKWIGKILTSVIAFLAIVVVYWYGVDDSDNFLDFVSDRPRVVIGGMLTAIIFGALWAAELKFKTAATTVVAGLIVIAWIVSGLRFPQFAGRAKELVLETLCQSIDQGCDGTRLQTTADQLPITAVDRSPRNGEAWQLTLPTTTWTRILRGQDLELCFEPFRGGAARIRASNGQMVTLSPGQAVVLPAGHWIDVMSVDPQNPSVFKYWWVTGSCRPNRNI
jgi:hypothetical protein